MALETVSGNLTDFNWEGRPELHPVLTFTPTGLGFNGSSGIFFPIPIDAIPNGSGGNWLVQLESATSQRDPDFHYTISCKWLNGEGYPVGYATSNYRLYVPVGGGNIGAIINAPLLRGDLWVSTDGSVPSSAVAGDLIWFVQTDNIDSIN